MFQTFGNQKYISTEMDSIYFFLCSNGYIFRLCYKLLSNSLFKFHIYFSDLPVSISISLVNYNILNLLF